MSKLFVIIGLVFVVTGLVLHFAPWLLNWFGKLPGDINYEKDGSRVFVPITSMIALSVVGSLLLSLFHRG